MLTASLLLLPCPFAALARPSTGATQPAVTASLEISGGIAGVDRRIDLSSTGAITAIDRRRKVTRTATAPVADLAALQSQLRSLDSLTARSPKCRDCLEYQLSITRGATRIVVIADDISLESQPAALVIRTLNHLLGRALSGDLQ